MIINYLRFFSVIIIFVSPNLSFASENTLSDQSIKDFYKDLVESKIAGGEYLISFHDKHYSDDLKMILNLKRKVNDNDMPRVFLDHNKETFMEAVRKNAEIINHKSGRYDVVSISMNDDGKSAEVHVRLVSQFDVQVDRLAPKRSSIEAMDCKDRVILSDTGFIQIVSSKCDVNVSMD